MLRAWRHSTSKFRLTRLARIPATQDMERSKRPGSTARHGAGQPVWETTRSFYQGAVHDNKPRGHIPLRIQMVRNAVFWPVVGNFASSLLRMATAKWEGTDLACILISGMMNDATDTPGC